MGTSDSNNALPKSDLEPAPEASPLGQPTPQSNAKRLRSMLRLSLLLIILVVLGFLYWFFYLLNKEGTDDAYVNGYVVNVTSSIPGSVTAFYADDADFVLEGQILVRLDPTQYKLQYEKAQSALALAVRSVVQMQQEVLQRRAEVKVRKANLDKAVIDYTNRQNLVTTLAVTREDYQHSQTDLDAAKASLSEAFHLLESSKAALGTTTLEEHPTVENAKTLLRQAYVDLQHCTILSPATGYVGKRSIEVGKWVNAGDIMMAVIPLEQIWVDANFKETQLEDLRVDQPVKLVADIYGGRVEYNGRVVGMVPGSGTVFSLLPAQNATGNWIKIVQRVPVRIRLNPDEVRANPLVLGLSTYATVNTSDQSGGFLKMLPRTEAVTKTFVYDIPMEEVEQLIDKIIADNKTYE